MRKNIVESDTRTYTQSHTACDKQQPVYLLDRYYKKVCKLWPRLVYVDKSKINGVRQRGPIQREGKRKKRRLCRV